MEPGQRQLAQTELEQRHLEPMGQPGQKAQEHSRLVQTGREQMGREQSQQARSQQERRG